jgi:hypothetical protein
LSLPDKSHPDIPKHIPKPKGKTLFGWWAYRKCIQNQREPIFWLARFVFKPKGIDILAGEGIFAKSSNFGHLKEVWGYEFLNDNYF